MNLELITTGTELLIGVVINRHTHWIGGKVRELGLRLARQVTVPDGSGVISEVLGEALGRNDVVFMTGGLGPTSDDISRETAAALLGRPLVEDPALIAHLTEWYARRNKSIDTGGRRLAQVPQGAEIMPNPHGTAVGLYFAPANGKPALFLLPGPPRELHPMFENEVMPRLRGLLPEGYTPLHEVCYRVTGLGESEIASTAGNEVESTFPDVEVGYCLGQGDVEFRLRGPAEATVAAGNLAREKLGPTLLSDDNALMEQVIVRMLSERGQTVATAESCTGGLVAHRLTNVPGASAVFLSGVVTYSNEAKSRDLNVPEALLQEHGAVGEQVARAMAEGMLLRAGTDHALSLTGIAGPGGGTPEKPVGTVWCALASTGQETVSQMRLLPLGRDMFKVLASQAALDMLRLRLLAK